MESITRKPNYQPNESSLILDKLTSFSKNASSIEIANTTFHERKKVYKNLLKNTTDETRRRTTNKTIVRKRHNVQPITVQQPVEIPLSASERAILNWKKLKSYIQMLGVQLANQITGVYVIQEANDFKKNSKESVNSDKKSIVKKNKNNYIPYNGISIYSERLDLNISPVGYALKTNASRTPIELDLLGNYIQNFNFPFFKMFPPQAFKEIAKYVQYRFYEAGQSIYTQGEASEYVAFVVSGNVSVIVLIENNDSSESKSDKVDKIITYNQLKVFEFNKGGFFGESSLVNTHHRQNNVIGGLFGCELLILSNYDYMKIVKFAQKLSLELKVQFFKSLPIFNRFNKSKLLAIAASAKEKTFVKKEWIVGNESTNNEDKTSIFFISQGEVSTYLYSDLKKELKEFTVIHSPEFFGEENVLDNISDTSVSNHKALFQCRSNSCVCYEISHKEFYRAMNEEIIKMITEVMKNRNIHRTEAINRFNCATAPLPAETSITTKQEISENDFVYQTGIFRLPVHKQNETKLKGSGLIHFGTEEEILLVKAKAEPIVEIRPNTRFSPISKPLGTMTENDQYSPSLHRESLELFDLKFESKMHDSSDWKNARSKHALEIRNSTFIEEKTKVIEPPLVTPSLYPKGPSNEPLFTPRDVVDSIDINVDYYGDMLASFYKDSGGFDIRLDPYTQKYFLQPNKKDSFRPPNIIDSIKIIENLLKQRPQLNKYEVTNLEDKDPFADPLKGIDSKLKPYNQNRNSTNSGEANFALYNESSSNLLLYKNTKTERPILTPHFDKENTSIHSAEIISPKNGVHFVLENTCDNDNINLSKLDIQKVLNDGFASKSTPISVRGSFAPIESKKNPLIKEAKKDFSLSALRSMSNIADDLLMPIAGTVPMLEEDLKLDSGEVFSISNLSGYSQDPLHFTKMFDKMLSGNENTVSPPISTTAEKDAVEIKTSRSLQLKEFVIKLSDVTSNNFNISIPTPPSNTKSDVKRFSNRKVVATKI